MQETLLPSNLIGSLAVDTNSAPLPGASWYTAQAPDDGFAYRFPTGHLTRFGWLSADFLLDGNELAVFVISLQEGESGPIFKFSFGLLNQASARMRMPLEAVNQNRWLYEREGAWLKPTCWGDRVDLKRVDRMTLTLYRKGANPVHWCSTPIQAQTQEPPRLTDPLLPNGVLLDTFGQSAQREWAGKTRSLEALSAHLRAQARSASRRRLPLDFSRWGGWQTHQGKASGFFRVQQGARWWLVDPDGCPFWSTGLDCVDVDTTASFGGLEKGLAWIPETRDCLYADVYKYADNGEMINYLAANFIRTFGAGWRKKWETITLAELRSLGFNTVGNWSDWQAASRGQTPYVRPLEALYENLPQVYRDFPDVFHPDFPALCAQYAEQLRVSRDDPALIGYFLMNEPTWGFAQETPAAGMLFNTTSCYSRTALAEFLRQRYSDDAGLSAAWEMPVRLAEVAQGAWNAVLGTQAQQDLADFSSVMVETFFRGLTEACRKVDPNHLNLGIRYYTVPPEWALAGMRTFDVFSMNCYRKRLPAQEMARISALLNMPILIGEWHFGALDVGLPASGIGHVPDQTGRGKAYRVYVEDAAAQPWCVGVHFFTLYDESAIGRYDGENYNIGFLDVCNQPYEPLCRAARATHRRMYRVAAGELRPYDQEPDYLPMLFL
jgi:hypothetical protein